MIKGKSSGTSGKKEKQTWSKSVTRNGITEEITVCEAENGYIVKHCKHGSKKNGEYFNEEKKYISVENPLEEEEKSFAESLDEILEEIAEGEGMINVKD